MSNGLTIVIVARRFWPISGPTETSIGFLASALAAAGHDVHVVTNRWHKHWPAEITWRNIQVTRIPKPRPAPWGPYRHERILARLLGDLSPDVVLNFGAPELLGVIRRAVGDDTPIVLRIGDETMESRSSREKVRSISPADFLIADSERTLEKARLVYTSLPDEISVMCDGVPFDSDQQRSLVRQAAARMSLSDAHPVLGIEPIQPLVVTHGSLHGDAGMIDLVHAWPVVLEQMPTARLWILGDGVRSRKVWDEITDSSLTHSIVMPGFIDDWEEVFQAADLYVHPLHHSGPSSALFAAVANQMCCVVTDSARGPLPTIGGGDDSAIRGKISFQRDVNAIVAPTGNPAALGEALLMAIRKPDLRARLGRRSKRDFQPAVDVREIANNWLNLIAQHHPSMEPS